MRNLILLLLLAVFLIGCKNDVERDNNDVLESPDKLEVNKFGQLNEMKWLLGNWENEDEGMISKEKWSKKNEDTYVGMSYRLLRSDTVFAEKMVLKQGSDGLILTVTALEGNKEGNPVSFKLVSPSKEKFIFENKKHDFPQRIIYTNPQKDKIHAWIEGDVMGEKQRIDFHFTRKNNL